MALADIKIPGQDYWAGTGRRQYRGEESDPDVYGEGDFWQKIIHEGYVPLSNSAVQAAPSPESLNYYNKTYGLNLKDAADYYRYIYNQPNAEVVNDPRLGPLLKVGPDAQEKQFLNYNPNPNEELFQALKYGGLAFGAGAGLSGLGALAGGGGAAGTGAGAAGIESAVAGGAGGAGGAVGGAVGELAPGTFTYGDAATNAAGNIGGTTANIAADVAETGAGTFGATETVPTWESLLQPGSTGVGEIGGLTLTPQEVALMQQTFPLTSGAAAGATALTGGAGPIVEGFNLFDPSTYSGAGASTVSSFLTKALSTLKEIFPNSSLSSLITGLAQGAFGYVGAKKQGEAIKNATATQNAAIQSAIDYAEKARTEQNAAYKAAHDESVAARDVQNKYLQQAYDASQKARTEQNTAYQKAHDESITARDVQNSYIQQAIDETRKGQASQDAAIQGGIDYSKAASEKYFGIGAPYRSALEASYKPGFSIWDDPATKDAAGQAATYAARGYSATSGNPFDQPAAQGGIYKDVLSQVALPRLDTYRGQLGTFGQMGISQAGAMDALTTAGTASLGNNDMAAVNLIRGLGDNAFSGIDYTAKQGDNAFQGIPYIAQQGNNAFQGINYTANQADTAGLSNLIASLGNNAFQTVANAGSGLNAIGAGVSTALNPPLTKQDLYNLSRMDYYGTEKPPPVYKP